MPIAINHTIGSSIQVRTSVLPKSEHASIRSKPQIELDHCYAPAEDRIAPREVDTTVPERPASSSLLRYEPSSLNNWQKLLGPDLRFQCGIFGRSGTELSLEVAGHCYLEHQLGLAGFAPLVGRWPSRILDVGCGWGYPLAYLARRFGTYTHVHGIDMNIEQLEHARRMLTQKHLADRVKLFHGSAENIDLLPAASQPYDLVMFRGSIKHASYTELDRILTSARKIVAPGGRIVIAENLYNIATGNVSLPSGSGTARLNCGDRKSPERVRGFLEAAGFRIEDMRILPNREDTIHWLMVVRDNIEAHFAADRPDAIEDLYAGCENLIKATSRGVCSMYSIVASPI